MMKTYDTSNKKEKKTKSGPVTWSSSYKLTQYLTICVHTRHKDIIKNKIIKKFCIVLYVY